MHTKVNDKVSEIGDVSVSIKKFICSGCGINIIVNNKNISEKCPNCGKLFETVHTQYPLAPECEIPSRTSTEARTSSLYRQMPPSSVKIIKSISIILLVAAALMQIRSIDDYIFQPVIITLYSVSILTFVLSRFIIAAHYKPPADNNYSPTVSVLIPCMNEEAVIRQTIERVFAVDYPDENLEVICVNDGSVDNTLEKMIEALTRYPGLVIVDFVENKGLCHGWAISTVIASSEVMVCVDSDTFIIPDSLSKLVQGFYDPTVGGISGHCDVENAQANILTKMQDVRYFFSYRIMKAAESVSGTVSCLPGCYSAYRRSCVLNVLDEWINSKVMGVSGNFADDRSLTNLILKDYNIIYDSRALATTIAPEKWSIYVKQQGRWNRSYLREVLKVSKWIWKKHPGSALAWLAMMWLPLIEPLILIIAMIVVPIMGYMHDGSIDYPWSYLAGLGAITGAWTLDYYANTGRKYWWTGFIYTLSYMLFFSWQVYWAFLTLTSKKWGTRNLATETIADDSALDTKDSQQTTWERETTAENLSFQSNYIIPQKLTCTKYARSWIKVIVAAVIALSILIPGVVYYGNMIHTPTADREWSVSAFLSEVQLESETVVSSHINSTLKSIVNSQIAGKKPPFALKHRKLTLGKGKIQTPIVHLNELIDAELFFCKLDKYEKNGAKKAALALAQGYITLLYLCRFDEIPLSGNKQLQALDSVIAALGPSAFLATCIQESAFVLDPNSGYFHLDVDPAIATGGEWVDSGNGFWDYCKFLENVSRKKTIQGSPQKTNIRLISPEYRPDITAFCCSAILKAYYDAGSWKLITENEEYSYLHKKAKKLLINYTLNPENNSTETIPIPDLDTQSYHYPAEQILLRILAWNYNRGRYSDNTEWAKPEWTFHVNKFIFDSWDGKTPLESAVKYIPYIESEHKLDYPWGARYIYQIPTIASTLGEYAAQGESGIFNAEITLHDITSYLNIISPLYPKAALNAGKTKAEKIIGDKSYAYNSPEFFDKFYAIVREVIEGSKR